MAKGGYHLAAASSTTCPASFCIAALRDLKTASINIRRVVIILYPAFPGNDERAIAVGGKPTWFSSGVVWVEPVEVRHRAVARGCC